MLISRFEKSIVEIAEFFRGHKIPYMIIGGIANLFWGEPRTTLDIDVTVKIKDENIEGFIKKIGNKFDILVSNPEKFIGKTRVLPIKAGVLKVDIIFAVLPYEEEAIKRAVVRKIGNAKVKICSLEDLIIHKIISERPKDIEDVKKILAKQKNKIDRRYLDPKIQELSKALDNSEIMKIYLDVVVHCKKQGLC